MEKTKDEDAEYRVDSHTPCSCSNLRSAAHGFFNFRIFLNFQKEAIKTLLCKWYGMHFFICSLVM